MTAGAFSTTNETIESIRTLANEAIHQGEPLDWGQPYMVRAADGEMRVVTTPPAPWDKPHYKKQNLRVIDAQSFTDYLEKHGDGPETEIRVNEDQARISAILDAGSKLTPGHQEHILELRPHIDDDWKAWARIDGDLMSQEDFADFIEDQALNITSPDAATMLEIATSMHVNTSVEFEQGHRQSDGQVRFAYRENSTTNAGANGDIEIPATIQLALSPFKGGATYQVEARLRWRIRSKQLAIGVKLVRPGLLKDAAFDSIVKTVEEWNIVEAHGEIPEGRRHLITRH